jgi:hypothetical protein
MYYYYIFIYVWIFFVCTYSQKTYASQNLEITIRIDDKNICEKSICLPEKTVVLYPYEVCVDKEEVFSDPFIEKHLRTKSIKRYTMMRSQKIVFQTREDVFSLEFESGNGVVREWLDGIREKSKDILIQVDVLDLDSDSRFLYLFQEGRKI